MITEIKQCIIINTFIVIMSEAFLLSIFSSPINYSNILQLLAICINAINIIIGTAFSIYLILKHYKD